MKRFAAFLLVITAVIGAPVLARSSADSPLIGRWAVDISRLPMPPAARPKRVTITFGEAGNGKWTMEVDITDAAGKRIHSVGTAALDGSVAHVKGSPEADTVAMKLPTVSTLVIALVKGGVPASTRIYAVAPGGRTMVETGVYFGDGGLPILRTNHFTRAH